MKLENQLVNLELSMRIKELGVPQDSVWYWINDGVDITQGKDPKDKVNEYVSAFTVAELGYILPGRIITYQEKGKFICEELENRCIYEDGGNYPQSSPYGEDDTEANARAKCLIYLIENGLYEV